MSALMKLPVIYVLTHDGIGVGEDGPTHQPIEQLAALRALPDMYVFRPADYGETAASYAFALNCDRPVALVLSRQSLSQFAGGEGAAKGGYVLDESDREPEVLLIATGSEVQLCVRAKEILKSQNIAARVISLPCAELFERQSEEYKNGVIPPDIKARVCVEAASGLGWREYAGDKGEIVAMRGFGISGSAEELYEHFDFTAEHIAESAKISLNRI